MSLLTPVPSKHFVRYVNKDDSVIAKCLSCDWIGPKRMSLTKASYDRLNHLGFKGRTRRTKRLTH